MTRAGWVPYAETGPLRLRQQALDVAVLVWSWLCVELGQRVHGLVLQLQEPGRQLEGAGARLAEGLGDAADRVDGAPLVGDRLRGPLDAAAEASRSVADAGTAGQDTVGTLALVLALVVALVPLLLVVALWLPGRVRWAREAGAARLLRGDVELLALRAATSLPLSRLATLGPEPVARWRRGEPGAAEALAALELRQLGLRPGAAARDQRSRSH